MTPYMGLNLRVTGHCSQGGRKYMEDAFVVAYQQTANQKDLEYAYFGIFDGHGGREAALFAKEHLMNNIVSQKSFWSDDDNQVLKAIRDGFLSTHQAMWKEFENWPKTVSGLPSTSGTTCSIAFIRRRKLFIGHVGDSKIVLGFQMPDSEVWSSLALTKDHKPESPEERLRINSAGGLVMNKAGVERVVWNRPHPGHKGPVRRNTPVDRIPFLAVARSLGDLWSYNYAQHEFVVSPDPDVHVVTINPKMHRCVIFASDGLWNMLSAQRAVTFVQRADKENEKLIVESCENVKSKQLKNPSKLLVDAALARYFELGMRADNTSVVTVMLDPPGPPKSIVLLKQKVMKRLRPRDEQIDEEDDVEKPATESEPTITSKGKKRPIETVEPSATKDPKQQPEVPSKERKLSNEGDCVPRNLPKVVILSPEKVTKHSKNNTEDKPMVSGEPSVENKSDLDNSKTDNKDATPVSSDTKLKKRGHDPPSIVDVTSSKISKSENKVSLTPDPATKSKHKSGETSTALPQPSSDKSALLIKNTPSPKSEKTESSCQNTVSSAKENGRVHLCEVDNIFKLNDRTTSTDCNDSRNISRSSDIQKSDISPKSKNFRKSTLLRRSCASHQKSISALRKSRLSEPSISMCRTRAQSNIQKLKV